jgi:fructan beta-fructosidase
MNLALTLEPDSDGFRPGIHFTSPKNWINDPNGLVFFAGEYHLFFQYNPFGNSWGHMSWGHAVSTDMVHWEHLPVAIPEKDGIMAFSGCAVVDSRNSSGFGEHGQPPLVLVFTGHRDAPPRNEDQRLVYSNDRGRSWSFFEGNPVLDIGAGDFCDPKVFWHEPSKHWVMIVVLPDHHQVSFYTSNDLKSWQHQSDFGPAGVVTGIWEVPELFELQVGNSSQTRWVLKVDAIEGGPSGGAAGQYFVGDFDGLQFIPEQLETAPNWVDYGKDFYAAISFSDIPETDGRRIWLGWMSNWQYARETPTHPWRGAMTIGRSLRLKEVAGSFKLVQEPIRELEALRGQLYELSGAFVQGSKTLDTRGTKLEIKIEFKPETATDFGLKVRVGEHHHTMIGYNLETEELFVDRSHSGLVDFSEHFPGKHAAAVKLEPGVLKLHVFVDQSSLEIFAEGGQIVITDLIYPQPEDDRVEVYAIGGHVQVKAQIWELTSSLGKDKS